MSADMVTAASAAGTDPIARIARWAITKLWLGGVLSAVYALGHHYGFPELLLTIAAVAGALFFAAASLMLPQWTLERDRFGTGLKAIDIGSRIVAWAAITVLVASLFISAPAAGAPAGALWLNTLVRTFGPGLRNRRDARRAARAARASARTRPVTVRRAAASPLPQR